MLKNIPHISFNPRTNENIGFEVIPLETIALKRKSYTVNPEKPHQLKFYNLIFFTEGKSKHFIDFKWYPVKKNSLIYLTKEQINAFHFTENLKGICLIFTEEYFVKSFAHLPKDFVYRLFNPQLFSPILQIPSESDFPEYLELLNKEYVHRGSFNREAIIESLFIILLSKAEHLKQNQTLDINDFSKITVFQKFISLLEKNYAKTRSANRYAKELAITYKHLNTICKVLINKTAKTIIDDYIILLAKRELINSEIKSTELAYKLGFEDPTNFSKYFKKYTGITPKTFKKSFQ